MNTSIVLRAVPMSSVCEIAHVSPVHHICGTTLNVIPARPGEVLKGIAVLAFAFAIIHLGVAVAVTIVGWVCWT